MSRRHTTSSRRASVAPSADFSDNPSDDRLSASGDLNLRSRGDSDGDSDADQPDSRNASSSLTPNQSPKSAEGTGSGLDFADAIEMLLEKRATVRETALKTIIAQLSNRYRPESVESSFHTLQSYLLRCARRGTSMTESAQACQALCLVYLTAGEEREATYRELSEAIKDSMLIRTSGAKASVLRGPVATLLSISCFVAGSDEDCVELALSLEFVLSAELSRTSAPQKLDTNLAVTLIQAIGILCSFPALNDDSRIRIRDALLRCLQHGMPAPIRVAAARTLAMFNERFASVEAGYPIDLSDEDELNPDLNSSSEILTNMEQLNITSVKSVAGCDRKSMRSAFRDVANYLNGSNGAPSLKIKVGKRTEILSTWVHHIRYDTLKSILGTGLSAHMMANDVVRFALDFEDFIDTQSVEFADSRSKKQLNQKSGVVQKLRTMDLKKQRQIKALRSSS